jgi:cell division protein FtsB
MSSGSVFSYPYQASALLFRQFQLTPNVATFQHAMNFYRNIRKQIEPKNLWETIKENKAGSALIFGGFILLLYVFFNSNGIVQRVRLEIQKKEMIEKIEKAEAEQIKLKEQSKALDGDPKAIEKVAREKYGMVRENEKVYKVAPKK